MIKILTFLFLSVTAQTYALTAEQLGQAFSCNNSQGPYLTRALNQSLALRSIYESIVDDPNCRGVANSLQALSQSLNFSSSAQSNLQTNILRLDDYKLLLQENLDLRTSQLYEQYFANSNLPPSADELENFKNSLQIDPLYVQLESAYASNYINLIQAEADFPHLQIQQRRDLQLDRLNQFRVNAMQVTQHLASASKCLQSHPDLAIQISTGLVATVSSVLGGPVGAFVAGGSVLVSAISSIVKELGWMRPIFRLSHENYMHGVVGCSLEKIAQTYCETGDALKIMEVGKKLKAENIFLGTQYDNHNKPLVFKGIELQQKSLRVFEDWLFDVRSGGETASVAQATERRNVIDLRAALDNIYNKIQGIIGEATNRLNNNSGNLNEVDVRRTAQNEVISELYGGLFNTIAPFRQFFSSDTDCGPRLFIYSLGEQKNKIGLATIPDGAGCAQIAEINYPNAIISPPSLEQLRNLVDIIMKESRDFIDNEFNNVFILNAELIMNNLNSEDSIFRETPKSFLNKAIEYLQELNQVDEFKYSPNQLVQFTLADLLTARNIINRTCEDYNEQREQLFNDSMEQYRERLDQYHISLEEYQKSLTQYYEDLKNWYQANCISLRSSNNLIPPSSIGGGDSDGGYLCPPYAPARPVAPVMTAVNPVPPAAPVLIDCKVRRGHAARQVTELNSLLAPQQDISYLGRAFRQIIKDHVDHELSGGELSDQELKAILLGSTNSPSFELIQGTLQSSSDTASRIADAKTARNIIRGNLVTFGRAFRRDIKRSMKRLKKYQESNLAHNEYQDDLGQLCIRSLLSPNEGRLLKKSYQKLCQGTEMTSAYPQDIGDLKYDHISKLKFEDRACKIYEFRRSHRLKEFQNQKFPL